MRIATGIDTLAYSSFPKNSGTAGMNRPSATPKAIHKNTHKERYREKKPSLFSDMTSSSNYKSIGIFAKYQKAVKLFLDTCCITGENPKYNGIAGKRNPRP
jgi:hypothetical protein